MELKSIAEQSTEELNKKLKQLKSEKIFNAVLVGFTVGVCAVSIIWGGFGVGSILSFIVAYLFIKNTNKSNALAKELEKELDIRQSH